MRRRGFTLIEVLAALAVITVTLMLGVVVGRKWVQEQREMAFCQRVVTEWNAMMVNAENSHMYYAMTITQQPGDPCVATFKREQDQTVRGVTVTAPPTLGIMQFSTIAVKRNSAQQFTQPKTIMLESKSGAVYKFVLELGWGRLKFMKNDVLVE